MGQPITSGIDSDDLSWMFAVDEAEEARIAAEIAAKPAEPASPRSWYDLPIAARMWRADATETER